jgi:hypothetical protein
VVNPNQDRAGQYLQYALKNIPEDVSSELSVEILIQYSALADKDFAECQTNQQKQKVWAGLLSAVALVVRCHDGEAIATHALREALINTSGGRSGDHSLTSRTIPNTPKIEIEWIRACTIALLDEYPKSRQQTCKDAMRFLKGDESSIEKMRANFRGGRIGGVALSDLVKTAKYLIKEFGYKKLSDLSDAKPPPRT